MESIVRVKKKCIEKWRELENSYCGIIGLALENARLKGKKYVGQGTTEYAILVGVLVVIAILAITIFRPKNPRIMGCDFLGYQWALAIKRCCASQAGGLLNMQLFLLRFFP